MSWYALVLLTIAAVPAFAIGTALDETVLRQLRDVSR